MEGNGDKYFFLNELFNKFSSLILLGEFDLK